MQHCLWVSCFFCTTRNLYTAFSDIQVLTKFRLMRICMIFIGMLAFMSKPFAQETKIRELSVGQSFIWNRTTVFDSYSGTRARNETGQAWSQGTDLACSFGLTKKLYGTVGLGYFNQRFQIQRGFDFLEPNVATGLFYATKKYDYKSISYHGGIGYRLFIKGKRQVLLSPGSELRLTAIVQGHNTFQQTFQHQYSSDFLGNPNPQKRKERYHYGFSVVAKAGLVRPVSNRFKIGLDLLVPVFNQWRKDRIFRESTNEYHSADFVVGTAINIIYNLQSKS